jgi:deoxyribonuclease-4
MRIGAHVSIAGGMDLAVERGVALDCESIQVFVKNNNQWKAFPLADDVVKRYKRDLKQCDIHPVVAHASYLINLATSDDALWEKSRASFQEELERCDILGIRYLVIHPGSHMGAGEEVGIRRVAEALNEIYARKPIKAITCIEHTAGQGNHIGYKFEHLASIRAQMKKKNRFGVCLDTCHLFAAGYDYRTPEKYKATLRAFDDIVGCEHIKCIHLNDSKTPLGSRVDRHAHIGQGKIGRRGFQLFLCDSRFQDTAGVIETPTDGTGKDERRNLRTLRRLAVSA